VRRLFTGLLENKGQTLLAGAVEIRGRVERVIVRSCMLWWSVDFLWSNMGGRPRGGARGFQTRPPLPPLLLVHDHGQSTSLRAILELGA
jgi:hypothetical protein